PTPARTSFSASSRAVSAGSAMRSRTSTLAAALTLALETCGLRNRVGEGWSRLRGCRLLSLLERDRAGVDGPRRSAGQPRLEPRRPPVFVPSLGLLALAPGELRLAFLPDR